MRIVSWNVCGDKGEEKWEELEEILNYWEAQGDPVGIICLQETSGRAGWIFDNLMERGYQTFTCPENENGGGRKYIIAVAEDLEVVENSPIHLNGYEELETSPTRVPYRIVINTRKGSVEIYTLHATLGARRIEALRLFSDYVNTRLNVRIVIAADLNAVEDEVDQTSWSEEAEYMPVLFEDFSGFQHHLDYILGRGIEVSDGISSSSSTSDHLPISAKLEF